MNAPIWTIEGDEPLSDEAIDSLAELLIEIAEVEQETLNEVLRV